MFIPGIGICNCIARHRWLVARLSAVALREGGSLITSVNFFNLISYFFLLTSYFSHCSRQLHFRSHGRKFANAFIETALEILRNIRVEWIRRQIRRQRAV